MIKAIFPILIVLFIQLLPIAYTASSTISGKLNNIILTTPSTVQLANQGQGPRPAKDLFRF